VQNNITYLKNCMSILIEYVNTTGDNNVSDNICHPYNNGTNIEPDNSANTNHEFDFLVNIGVMLGAMAVSIVMVYSLILYFHKRDQKIKNTDKRRDIPLPDS
ncbi:MAG: hypothetical protein ACTSVV_06325, partial [Promethearchaeota archaeon]